MFNRARVIQPKIARGVSKTSWEFRNNLRASSSRLEKLRQLANARTNRAQCATMYPSHPTGDWSESTWCPSQTQLLSAIESSWGEAENLSNLGFQSALRRVFARFWTCLNQYNAIKLVCAPRRTEAKIRRSNTYLDTARISNITIEIFLSDLYLFCFAYLRQDHTVLRRFFFHLHFLHTLADIAF